MSTSVTANPELAARFNIERLLKIREVELLTGQHRQTLWRKAKQGKFPMPRKLGALNVWPESEIRAWIASVLDGKKETEGQKPIPPQLQRKANSGGEPVATLTDTKKADRGAKKPKQAEQPAKPATTAAQRRAPASKSRR